MLNRDVLRQGLHSQWKELIITPLTRAKFHWQITLNFVVDALDECSSDNDIRILIHLFTELKEVTNANMGVFVTSRPEVVMRLGFKDVSKAICCKLDLHEISSEIVEHDILVFVRKELSKTAMEHELIGWPKESELQLLVKNAGRLFIYAATACRFIADISWDPAERLSEIIEGHSSDGEPATYLDEMYEQVLESSLMSGRDAAETAKLCNRFKEVVGTIVVLFDELSVPPLAELLSRRASWVRRCLVNLHSVLNVPDSTSSPIRLLHPSLRDFLLCQHKRESKNFSLEEWRIHAALVAKCLGIIATSLSRNLCSLPTPGSSPNEAKPEILNAKLPKHVQYACLYWVAHLECARRTSNENAQIGFHKGSQVHEFIQKHFINWLEAMSLLGNMTQAVHMMTKLAAMTQVCITFFFSSSIHYKLALVLFKCIRPSFLIGAF